MFTPSLTVPIPKRIPASVVFWFVPQFPPPLPRPAKQTAPPPPPPPVKIPAGIPAKPQRWDRPLPDPMAFVLMDDWEQEQKTKHSSGTPRLS